MDSSKWLITGATGLLGANAAIEISKTQDVIGVARNVPASSPTPFIEFDLSNPIGRSSLIDKSEPGVVLHCAALSTHESCESNPTLAWEINVNAARELAKQSADVGSRFIYISTDAVFDGNRGNYSENDLTSPVTTYAKTKYQGEIAVLEENPNALVLRVNFYGWSPTGTRSLAEFFVNKLKQETSAPGFVDVTVSTMYVGTLVSRIQQLVHADARGTFHVANDEPISKFDFGRAIATRLGVDPNSIYPSFSTEVLSVARGMNTSLNTSKLRDKLHLSTSQSEDLDSFFKDFEYGRPGELKNFLP